MYETILFEIIVLHGFNLDRLRYFFKKSKIKGLIYLRKMGFDAELEDLSSKFVSCEFVVNKDFDFEEFRAKLESHNLLGYKEIYNLKFKNNNVINVEDLPELKRDDESDRI